MIVVAFILCHKNVGNLPTGDLHERRYETFLCVSSKTVKCGPEKSNRNHSILILVF